MVRTVAIFLGAVCLVCSLVGSVDASTKPTTSAQAPAGYVPPAPPGAGPLGPPCDPYGGGTENEGEGILCNDSEDTFNAGCNATVPVFSAILEGVPVNGTTSTFNDAMGLASRDTDWYGPISVPNGSPPVIVWEVTHNTPITCDIFIIQDVSGGACTTSDIVAAVISVPQCTPTVVSYTATPGTGAAYYLFIAPSDFGDGADCVADGGAYDSRYQGVFTRQGGGTCVFPPGPGWSDDFDSYAAGSTIGGQGAWEPWDSTGTDALVDGTISNSPPNSLMVGGFGDNFGDVVRPFCDMTPLIAPQFTVTATVLVPEGMTGSPPAPAWFILLNTYQPGGAKNWSVQVQMSNDVPGEVFVTNAGGSTYDGSGASLTVPTDTWFQIVVDVNLETDTHDINVFQDGLLVGNLETMAPWSGGGPGSNVELQAIDLFSNGSSGFFYDDINGPIASTEQFIRGDVNNDGIINFLVEAVFALAAGFVPGSPQPECLAAADANGDRVINFLVEAVYLLAAGFVPGSPPPPLPYPDCGPDVNGVRVIGCDTPSCP